MDLLMDLSKVFDALNHVFLLGKNHACSIVVLIEIQLRFFAVIY